MRYLTPYKMRMRLYELPCRKASFLPPRQYNTWEMRNIAWSLSYCGRNQTLVHSSQDLTLRAFLLEQFLLSWIIRKSKINYKHEFVTSSWGHSPHSPYGVKVMSVSCYAIRQCLYIHWSTGQYLHVVLSRQQSLQLA